jgi:hypothetical protein
VGNHHLSVWTTSGGATPYGTSPCPLLPLVAVKIGALPERPDSDPNLSNRITAALLPARARL